MTKSKSTKAVSKTGTKAKKTARSGTGPVDAKKRAKKAVSDASKLKALREKRKGRLTKRELEAVVPDHKTFDLSIPQLRFVANYIIHDGNVSKASRACHPEKTAVAASSFGTRMMQRENVVDAIDAYREHWFGDLRRECRDKVLKVLYSRAFYDPAKIIGQDGNFLTKANPNFCEKTLEENDGQETWDNQKRVNTELGDLPRDLRNCVDGIERKSSKHGVFTTIKLAPRTESIRMLTEAMGLFDKEAGGQQDLTEDTQRQLRDVFNEVD